MANSLCLTQYQRLLINMNVKREDVLAIKTDRGFLPVNMMKRKRKLKVNRVKKITMDIKDLVNSHSMYCIEKYLKNIIFSHNLNN